MFLDFFHCFVQTYLDNIVIYSKTLNDHYLYIWQILERLLKAEIQANINKYKFFIWKIKFFGFINFIKGIKINQLEFSTILD